MKENRFIRIRFEITRLLEGGNAYESQQVQPIQPAMMVAISPVDRVTAGLHNHSTLNAVNAFKRDQMPTGISNRNAI